MSDRELAKNLIDRIPEGRLFYVIAYLQGAAMAELDGGGGHRTNGTTEELFAGWMEEDDA